MGVVDEFHRVDPADELTSAAERYRQRRFRRPPGSRNHRGSRISIVRRVFLMLVILLIGRMAMAADLLIDDVPLPGDVAAPRVPDGASAAQAAWIGVWVGAWGGNLRHILLVRSVNPDGEAQVIYAVGDLMSQGISGDWRQQTAKVSDDRLTISGAGWSATYDVTGPTSANAVYHRGPIPSRATMTKMGFADLTRSGATIPWTRGQHVFLATDLQEGGVPVRLEAVIFKPPGAGPFPLAVINHGSTGLGITPILFQETWFSVDLADFLNARSWLVAFPQRRGRGKSDGLYDEGFAADRMRGYARDPEHSLPGADRALVDIAAAVAALRRRPDVSSSPILIGGQSRGGILSIAYAGAHPDQVAGVINFVGGWVGESSASAGLINSTLFRRGGAFAGPTLWLYGRGDPTYSIAHSRGNFEAFRESGGHGEFLEFDVPGGSGHRLLNFPELWRPAVSGWLDARMPFPRIHSDHDK